jgi:hypothetical protein
MSGTEDSILGNIPDFQDEGGSSADSGQASTGTPQGESGEGQSSAQPTTTGGQGSGTQSSAQPDQVRRRHDGLVEVPNADNPNTRDLVDPISGRTVARGGIERRVFEDGQRAARENNQLKTELSNARGMLGKLSEVTQEAVRLNVAPQDQVIAIRVMADFMRDPVRTLQTLVEEVKAKGYQIPFLEQGVTPGMDLSAISRLIDNKMQPFTQTQQQQRQAIEEKQRAEADVNRFIEDNPESNANLDVLSEMLQAQPGLPLQSAYTKMIRWAHENGLDWTQPLKAQIAQMHEQRSQQPTPQQTTQQEPRPIPGRRSASRAGATSVNGSGGQQFNENASWADIIRQAMQESNVQLN